MHYCTGRKNGCLHIVIPLRTIPSVSAGVLFRLTFKKIIHTRGEIPPPRVRFFCLIPKASVSCRSLTPLLLLLASSCPRPSIISTPCWIFRRRGSESITNALEPSRWILLEPPQLVLHPSSCSERGKRINALSLPFSDDSTEEGGKVDAVGDFVWFRAAEKIGECAETSAKIVWEIRGGIE